MNKSSLDRGFGRCVVLRKYGATLKKYKNRTTDRVVRPTLDANKQVSDYYHVPFHFPSSQTFGREGPRLLRLQFFCFYGFTISAASLLHCKSEMPYRLKRLTPPGA